MKRIILSSIPPGLTLIALLVFSFSGCEDNAAPTGDVTAGIDISQGAFSVSDFTSADSCKSCHPAHFEEWSGSMHAYAIKDPVFTALSNLGRRAYINAVDQGCVKCHTVIGSRAGETPWGEFKLSDLSPVAKEGVTCDVCHTISSIGALQNSEIVLTPDGTRFGSIADPQPTDAHESEYHPLYNTSEYCASCHDIITDDGLGLETTFREWRSGGFALTGKTCNDCHMPEYSGQASVNSPQRTVHRHTFVGTDLAFIDFPQKAKQLQLVTNMLQSAVTMSVSSPANYTPGAQYTFGVDITNDQTGHDVPTGATFLRQIWLSIEAKDALGGTLFETGRLDANLDLMDAESEFPARDTNLTSYHATMYKADGVKTIMPWEVASLANPSIKPGETKSETFAFDIPPGVTGDITLDIKLRYRSFPPHFLRKLGLDSLLPITIIDMESRSITIPQQ